MSFFNDPSKIDPGGDYSITKLVDFIRRGQDGHSVREAIAMGIETAYDDASENGNANMEVTIARGTYPNLRSRLDENEIVVSQVEPTNANIWYEVKGATPAFIGPGI